MFNNIVTVIIKVVKHQFGGSHFSTAYLECMEIDYFIGNVLCTHITVMYLQVVHVDISGA